METSLDTPPTGAEQIAGLRAELDQRDATIDLLARQLEEAANRLDWLSRCGSDKDAQTSPPRSAEANPSTDLGGETAERLSRFLQQWEESEVGESLERIDRRLSHVFELLKTRDSDGHDQRTPTSNASRTFETAAEPPSGSLLTAFLLSQSADADQPAKAPPATSSESAGGSSQPVERPDVCLLPLPDFTPPQTIDLETASVEALRAAVLERDECIQQLLARSRMAEANRTRVPDWESLASAPEDLRERVAQLEIDLQQRIKQEELSSSIERAKLFRDRAHLDQVRRELESQIRKLGEMQHAAVPDSQEADRKATTKRWSKVFGR